MDAPIRNLTRPSVARVCVLVDLLKDMPNLGWGWESLGAGNESFTRIPRSLAPSVV
mgnify:CR=1 FL=1|jgi:hypothetical protein